MKPNLTDPGKVIITVATTGGLHGREANAALPEQPKDIIQSFKDCYNAGATVAHMHVRDHAASPPRISTSMARWSTASCPAVPA